MKASFRFATRRRLTVLAPSSNPALRAAVAANYVRTALQLSHSVRLGSTSAAIAHDLPPRTSSHATSFTSTSEPAAPEFFADVEPVEENTKLPFSAIKGTISHDTYKAITVKPFNHTHMSPVQAAVLPLIPDLVRHVQPVPAGESQASPQDLLVKAKTGTGKTLAFLVPAIEARIEAIKAHVKQSGATGAAANIAARQFARNNVGTVIISPTRELATQIAVEASKLVAHQPGFEVKLFVGGENKGRQINAWRNGSLDIIVATPGRLRDVLQSEPTIARMMGTTKTYILDEADNLLDMGFRDDLDAIVEYLPKKDQRQTFLFSATVSKPIQQVARAMLDPDHKFINTVSEDETDVHPHIPQFHTVLPSPKDQLPHLLRLLAQDQLANPGKSKTIVFLPTTKMTELFANILRFAAKKVLPAGKDTMIYEIHSKKQQSSRTHTSNNFRRDQSGAAILLTSDVSARGVDYPGVTRVVQIGIPGSAEQYTHRVGRTGRAGTSGRGDLVLLPWEIGFLSWQLGEVPLKPMTIKEVEQDLEDLVAKHDADPQAFFPAVQPPPRRGSRDRRDFAPAGPRPFEAPVAARVAEIDSQIEMTMSAVDPVPINETFASLLGYYVSKSPELRVQKGVVVEGCKTWAVEGMRMARAPYVSEQFLARLGMKDGRTKHFGKAIRDDRRQTGSGYGSRDASWVKRGRTRRDDDGAVGSAYGGGERLSPNDPSGSPEEYRTPRYGAREYSQTRTRSYGSDGGEGDERRAPRRAYGDRDRPRDPEGRNGGSYGAPRRSFGDREGGARERRPYQARDASGERHAWQDRSEGGGEKRSYGRSRASEDLD
ncbi:hypothetical protein BOTBODRAFT_191057 [Botryobasidium botryosum FD-172 SS1]|uniref:ATP-dependent RNA helicase n=1 Tax=Botryobasidium botryosum (strain FD-172 SS1) TaxID=930990 RepID=A0A067MCX0_BOTB1|nr:hypothetical protein BOTBODRAFT_191057 [Botryobasidium botryosum FD-172 SS1]